MLPTQTLDALELQAAQTLAQLMATAKSEPVRCSAALGVLRYAERARKNKPPSSATTSPGGDEGQAPPEPAENLMVEPLSEPEALEILTIFPHLDPVRVRRPDLAHIWRADLIEGRRWRDHYALHPDT